MVEQRDEIRVLLGRPPVEQALQPAAQGGAQPIGDFDPGWCQLQVLGDEAPSNDLDDRLVDDFWLDLVVAGLAPSGPPGPTPGESGAGPAPSIRRSSAGEIVEHLFPPDEDAQGTGRSPPASPGTGNAERLSGPLAVTVVRIGSSLMNHEATKATIEMNPATMNAVDEGVGVGVEKRGAAPRR